MFHFMMSAPFQYINKTIYMVIYIRIRFNERVPYTALPCHIYNNIKFFFSKKLMDTFSIGNIQLNKGEISFALNLFKSIKFKVDIIIVINIVYTHNSITLFHESAAQVISDKTCRTCNLYFSHFCIFISFLSGYLYTARLFIIFCTVFINQTLNTEAGFIDFSS